MKPIHTPNLDNTLKNSNLLLDTCTIIEMLKSKEICKLIRDLTKFDCTLLSIPPVIDEFTYGANTPKEYDDFIDFILSQGILILDETGKTRSNHEKEIIKLAISRCKRIKPSYVDRMLLSIPYFYSKSPEKIYLATLNHKDIPIEFYKCIGTISYCLDRTFRNIGFYEFENTNFERMIADAISKLRD